MATCLFIGAHQDDETLIMGAGIANHVNGGHKVYVGTISDGAADSFFAAGGLGVQMGISQADWISYRNAERNMAMGYLRATVLEASQGRLRDGTLNLAYVSSGGSTYDLGNDLRTGHLNMNVVSRVKSLIDQAASLTGVSPSAVRVKTHTYNEQHPDHMAVCAAVLYWRDQGYISDVTHYVHIGVWNAPNGSFPSMAQLGGILETCPQVIWLRDALLSYCNGSTMLGGMYYGFATKGLGYATAAYAFPIAWDGQKSYYCYPPAAVVKDATSGWYDNMPVQKVTVGTPLYASASTGSTVLMNMGVGEAIVTALTTASGYRKCIGGKVGQTNMIEGYILDANCTMVRATPVTYARSTLTVYTSTAKTTTNGTIPAGSILVAAGGQYAADVLHAYDGGKLIKITGYKTSVGGSTISRPGYVLTNWTSGSISSYSVYFG